MNQPFARRLRIEHILFGLAFVVPFVVIILHNRALGVGMPWWGLTIISIYEALLVFEVLDRYDPKTKQNKVWQAISKRERVVYTVVVGAGFGMLVATADADVRGSGYSGLTATLGIVLIGIGLNLLRQYKHRPTD